MQIGKISDAEILSARPAKNVLNPFRPYHWLIEPEYSSCGTVEDVATVFLTNRECPLRCLMCDLWKNTTDERVPVGAIPAQIEFALSRLPAAPHIKLYNSGNFFDGQAVPPEDFARIGSQMTPFSTVIVENHPRFCSDRCVAFQQQCETQLEVAMGLETSDEDTLKGLNKQMTVTDFAHACEFLLDRDIQLRAFILLRPPGTSEAEGIRQAIESVGFAFDCGVNCCVIIPTRSGNGITNQLQQIGAFQPPALPSLEVVIDETLSWGRGRVFADLWDARQFSTCLRCVDRRMDRLRKCNLTQQVPRQVTCECGTVSV